VQVIRLGVCVFFCLPLPLNPHLFRSLSNPSSSTPARINFRRPRLHARPAIYRNPLAPSPAFLHHVSPYIPQLIKNPKNRGGPAISPTECWSSISPASSSGWLTASFCHAPFRHPRQLRHPLSSSSSAHLSQSPGKKTPTRPSSNLVAETTPRTRFNFLLAPVCGNTTNPSASLRISARGPKTC